MTDCIFKMADEFVCIYIDNVELRVYDENKILGLDARNGTWKNKVGAQNQDGYRRVLVGKKYYYAHRVMYLARNPEWDIHDNSKNNFIDHINHTENDNSVNNLRVVTAQQNQFNRRGVNGVSKCEKTGRFRVRLQLNRKKYRFGAYLTREEAIIVANEVKEWLHG